MIETFLSDEGSSLKMLNLIWQYTYLVTFLSTVCIMLFFYLVHWDAMFRGNSSEKFRLHTELNPNVGVLRLFPGITDTTVSILGLSCNAGDFSWKADYIVIYYII